MLSPNLFFRKNIVSILDKCFAAIDKAKANAEQNLINAKELFEKHPDMVLRLEDISVFVANWENKASNIRNIQEILNIGFDSVVFLDDNPFERNLVRLELPDVIVPELPEDPAEYLDYLLSLNLFETASFSKTESILKIFVNLL